MAAQNSAFDPAAELTERGVYRVTLQPHERTLADVPVGELHPWIVQVATKEGVSFIPGQLQISGGMPAHGHGLPSAPRATRYLGDGRFLIEGMQFNMSGRWQLIVSLTGPHGLDKKVYWFELGPGASQTQTTDATRVGKNAHSHHANRELTSAEKSIANSLWLGNLPPAPATKDNRLRGNERAIELGKRLFFDPGLSAGGNISCASCHEPKRAFTDGRARSFGSAKTARNAPSLVGVAHSPWLYWDGRRDSLWSQALTPVETKGEMDGTRVDLVRYVYRDAEYRALLASVASTLPSVTTLALLPAGAGPYADKTGKRAWQLLSADQQTDVNKHFVLLGKALAAYQMTLAPAITRFDQFVDMLANGGTDTQQQLTASELRGLRLFLDPGATQCMQCHNGPLLTNQGFHNIGTGPDGNGGFDYGRAFGLQAALFNPFNCRSNYSDDQTCTHLDFSQTSSLPGSMTGAFKVPGLRNLTLTGPYMHDGRHQTLMDVLRWYNNPPSSADSGHELRALNLTEAQLRDLESFLLTLSPSATGNQGSTTP